MITITNETINCLDKIYKDNPDLKIENPMNDPENENDRPSY